MRPFRKHVAIAIDGGGMRGVIVARALMMLERTLNQPLNQIFQLAAGTSTGSIIAAAVAAGLPALKIYQMYLELGPGIFKKTLRSRLWPLMRYRYPAKPLAQALYKGLGDRMMGDFWKPDHTFDLVITTFDLKEERSCFIKPWKYQYQDWHLADAVQASCTVPTYFPPFNGRYVDGGVGSYANPCYLAAYEAYYCLGWDPAETTLISLGTGRAPQQFYHADKLQAWQWLTPVLDAFGQSAQDQQMHLVQNFFAELDFRRFQVNLAQPIAMDDTGMIPRMAVYGDTLGRMLLSDQMDPVLDTIAKLAPQPLP